MTDQASQEPDGVNSQCLLSFKAGRLLQEGKSIRPDSRSGTLRLILPEDEMMHLQWTPSSTENPEVDLIVFPGSARFAKVKSSNDRVYVLKMVDSDVRSFFWMQEASVAEDEARCAALSSLLQDGPTTEVRCRASHVSFGRLALCV